MIKIDDIQVNGFEEAIRGMRNSFNSWVKSDAKLDYTTGDYIPGSNDLELMQKLIKAGSSHSKFMRFLIISCDVTAPLYWWKEFDTYKVGTVANSCSTMHTIHAKPFEADDFSNEYIFGVTAAEVEFGNVITVLNGLRDDYIRTKDMRYWYAMIQLLPESYNQKRTILINYEVLRKIFYERSNHKLSEWREFVKRMIEDVPYGKELITIH